MTQKFGVFLLILFFAFILIFFGMLYNKNKTSVALSVDFLLPSLFIESEMLNTKELIGKQYIINIFASWCETCHEEHKFWLEVARKNIIDIYGINYFDTHDKVQKWLLENDNPYKMVVTDYDGQVSRMLKVSGLPETFVINSKGNIICHIVGNVTAETWQEQILPVLE